MRVLAGTTLIAVAVSFGAGQAAVQNGAVRNRVDCESLAGLALPATAIGLPTSGATIAAAELDSRRRRRPSLPIERCWRYRNTAA